jgi:phosphosulfolactate phosphohydrolase-like enzyme
LKTVFTELKRFDALLIVLEDRRVSVSFDDVIDSGMIKYLLDQ